MRPIRVSVVAESNNAENIVVKIGTTEWAINSKPK
jgi:hypothetical protein